MLVVSGAKWNSLQWWVERVPKWYLFTMHNAGTDDAATNAVTANAGAATITDDGCVLRECRHERFCLYRKCD